MPEKLTKIQKGDILHWTDPEGLETGTFIVSRLYADGDFIIRNRQSRVRLSQSQTSEVTKLPKSKGKELEGLTEEAHPEGFKRNRR